MAVILRFPRSTGASEPDEEIVEFLEILLAQARSGDLQSVVIATADMKGTPTVSMKMDRGAAAALIGAIRVAEKQLINAIEVTAESDRDG